MKIWSKSITDGERIPARFAMGKHDPETHATFSDNVSPHLAWGELPDGTKSLAVTCIDVDVPSVGDDVNQEGKSVPHDLPRVDFFHWAMVDLDAGLGSVAEGAFCSGVTVGGKAGPVGPLGTRHGKNDYTGWFAGDETMGGDYYGYDGPFPPWNDTRLHHYHFTVYALDVDRADLGDAPSGADIKAAIEGHVLASATIVGTYSTNPDVTG